MRKFTVVLLSLFAWLSASHTLRADQQCAEKCELHLDNEDQDRIEEFAGRADCCVNIQSQFVRPYSVEHNIDLEHYPPAVNISDVTTDVEIENGKPVLILSFKYPMCRPGAYEIVGFTLRALSTKGGPSLIRRLLFTDAALDSDSGSHIWDRLNVTYRLRDLSANAEYLLEIQSLPEEQRGKTATYKNTLLNVPFNTNEKEKKVSGGRVGMPSRLLRAIRSVNDNRAENFENEIKDWMRNFWSDSVTFNGTKGTTNYTVIFWQAPCEYNIVSYKFHLSKCADKNDTNCNDELGRIKLEHTKELEERSVTFQNVSVGFYRLLLDVRDVHRERLSKFFFFNISKAKPPPVAVEGYHTVTPQSGESKPPEEPGVSAAVVGAIVGGVVVGILLVVLIFCVLRQQRQKSPTSFPKQIPCPTPTNNLEMKNVAILSSSDREEHNQCIEYLVHFLMSCKCEVSWPPADTQKMSISIANYMRDIVNKAHYIIIIHSEGAWRKHQLIKDGDDKEIVSLRPRPEGDPCPPAIEDISNKIFCKREMKQRVLNAYFNYTQKEFLIREITCEDLPTFCLMENFQDLIAHIHKLNSKDSFIKSLDKEETFKLLEDAIGAVKKDQDKREDWFWDYNKLQQKNGLPCAVPMVVDVRNGGADEDQLDSGLGGDTPTHLAEIHHASLRPDTDSDTDGSAAGDKNISMFPYSLGAEREHNFVMPVDFPNKKRNKKKREETRRLNNASPGFHPSGLDPWNNNTDHRLHQNIPLQNNTWRPYESGHRGFNNPTFNSTSPSSEVPYGASAASNLPFDFHASNAGASSSAAAAAARSVSPTPREQASEYADSAMAQCPSATPTLSVRSANTGAAASAAGGAYGGYPSSSLDQYSNFPDHGSLVPTEDASFVPPMCSDTSSLSSLNSDYQNRQLIQVNQEADYHNEPDSGHSSLLDSNSMFHPPDDHSV